MNLIWDLLCSFAFVSCSRCRKRTQVQENKLNFNCWAWSLTALLVRTLEYKPCFLDNDGIASCWKRPEKTSLLKREWLVKSAETGIKKSITQQFLKSYTDQFLLINPSLFLKYLSILWVNLSIIIEIYLYLSVTINIHYVLKLNLHKQSSIYNCYSQTNKQRKVKLILYMMNANSKIYIVALLWFLCC